MSQLLHQKHEAFCQAYVRGPHAGNYTAAYEAAGYARIDSNASRLAGQPHIKKRIAELLAENETMERAATKRAIAALALDKEMILRELMKIGFANAFDYLHLDDDDQAQLDLARLERDKGAAVRSLTVDFEDAPDGARRIKRIRFALFEKRLALIDLGRHIGMFTGETPDLKEQATAGATAMWWDLVRLTAPELDERLIGMFSGLAEHGVDLRELLERAIADGRVAQYANDKPLREVGSLRDQQTIAWNGGYVPERSGAVPPADVAMADGGEAGRVDTS
jgi:phage terminase small subunit